ncbi:AAA family ATPase [Sediminitomix flava]|uniref:MoxR-like ATPase n=1 Tax=Sediminitomix flava TaxID=379075 RepID=A0A315ZG09_SEDFL|nr:MoxR family ATPase [Sediminitomix flava]PWJ44252.1 MoxR-like ATPase [Sediminitomix flava]
MENNSTLNQILELETQIGSMVIGQDDLIRKLVIGLLADGNLLLESVPGLAKTRTVKSLAKGLDTGLSRIQFTPDLLPSDVTGTEIYQADSEEKFVFQQGPIFSNLILADEINRAPAKVQAALLEAMEERQVSVAGKTHQMAPLFMVLATQNPVEQEGTYPLPEAQMDRFLMHVKITYPSSESEKKILNLVRNENKSDYKKEYKKYAESLVFEAREQIEQITVNEAAVQYIVDLIDATRFPEKYSEELNAWLDYGASPRGSIALDKCARVQAWISKRDYVTSDDIRAVVHDVLRHRLILSYEANAKRITSDQVIDKILEVVAIP